MERDKCAKNCLRKIRFRVDLFERTIGTRDDKKEEVKRPRST